MGYRVRQRRVCCLENVHVDWRGRPTDRKVYRQSALVWSGLVKSGLVCYDLVWSGLVWSG